MGLVVCRGLSKLIVFIIKREFKNDKQALLSSHKLNGVWVVVRLRGIVVKRVFQRMKRLRLADSLA